MSEDYDFKRTKKKELKPSHSKLCKRSETWAKLNEIESTLNLTRNRNYSTFQCPLCETLLKLPRKINKNNFCDTWIPKHFPFLIKNEEK